MRNCLLLSMILVALASLPGASSAQGIPTQDPPQTIPPTDIATGTAEPTDSSAVVLGYFNYGNTNPPGIARNCWFEYGTTASFGSRQSAICSGTTKATLAPLLPGTTYYYLAGASNEAGTTYGPTVRSFTTLGSPPPPPPPGAVVGAALSRVTGQSLSAVLRRGLKFKVTVTGACPCVVRAKVTVAGKTAASLTRTYAKPTASRLTLKLKAAVKRKLKRKRSVKLKARVTATGTSGPPVVLSRTVKLKRSY